MRRTRLVAAVVSLVLVAAACHASPPPETAPEEQVTRPTIEEVQEAHTAEWMRLPGVVGVGLALCGEEPCIRVFLSRPSPEAEAAIPERVEGYLVDVQVSGTFEPRVPRDS